MDYDKASRFWDDKDSNNTKLNKDELNILIDNYINSHNTCCLATGFGTNIRCTPIEYNYYNGYFYLISEGGHKFSNLKNNKNVALAIYDSYKGFQECNGMQINGVAEIIDENSKEYEEIFLKKKISLEALKKLNHPMYLIKIKPIEINFLSSEFKKMGLNTMRQKLIR